LSKPKALVIGDNCTDEWIYGSCDRICPEGPAPVFVQTRSIQNQGMAGNTNYNLRSLVGDEWDITFVCNLNPIIKTRYVEEKSNGLIVRVDTGDKNTARIPEATLTDLAEQFWDVIIISDYNKGFLHTDDIDRISRFKHCVSFMDTKKIINGWAAEVDFIKINQGEVDANVAADPDFTSRWYDQLITTVGKQGCDFRGELFPVAEVEIKDLVGAGDTFLAALAVGYVKSGGVIEEAITFANLCSTEIVQAKGVGVIRPGIWDDYNKPKLNLGIRKEDWEY